MGKKIITKTIISGSDPKKHFGSINDPIFKNSTLIFNNYDEFVEAKKQKFNKPYYGRINTYTSKRFEKIMCSLYECSNSVLTSSGLSAIAISLTSFLSNGDEILITELEHHSNYVPWHYLRKSRGIKIEFAEINQDGEITLESIEKKINSKTKLIAVTHLSNVTGAILPVKEITALAHSKNIPVLIDGCQGAPHLKIDMQDLDCDFYAISCHKMYGPTGLGVLYAKRKWLEELPPYQGGGGMIGEVKKSGITYGDLPNKFEAGTMATAQVIAFDESIKFLNKLGIENIMRHEKELLDYGQEVLRKNNSVRLIGNPKNKGGVLSFTLDGIHPHDIATILDEDGVAIRAGHHCCQILHDKLEIPATARASLGVYNTKDDLDKLNESLNKCKKIFNGK